MTRAISVGLGDRAYEVVIGPGLIDAAGGRIAPILKDGRTAVVTDETVASLHGERLMASLEAAGLKATLITIPPGEASKTFAGLESLLHQLLALRLDRGDLITAFGGGVVGDLAGFAAAIYKRGIDFVQIPTTLLAQVDSSVGGKTAIDTPHGKNLVGAFHQPRLVLADLDVLARRVVRRDTRPLITGKDPLAVLEAQAAERYRVFALADITVETGDTAHHVAVDAIVKALAARAAQGAS